MEFKNIFKNSIEAVKKSAKDAQAFISTAKLGVSIVPTANIMSCTCIVAIAVKTVDELVFFFEDEEHKSIQFNIQRGRAYALHRFDDRYYFKVDSAHAFRLSETTFRKYFVEHVLEDNTNEK
jgi:hypothetical protein